MERARKKVQLDRAELLLVFALVFLLSSLMFSLGILVGYGIHPPAAEEGGHEGPHLSAKAAEASGHGEGRAPASVADGEEPGAAIKKAYQDSKQRALAEMALRDESNTVPKPKSVIDEEAHFESLPKGRAPASDGEESAENHAPTPAAKVAAPGANGAAVKSLFERSPATLDQFAPASGTFTVQIASYPAADESEAKVKELRKAGFNEAYVQKSTWKGETWYRVGVGSYPTSDWARKAGDKLVRRKLASHFVVRKID